MATFSTLGLQIKLLTITIVMSAVATPLLYLWVGALVHLGLVMLPLLASLNLLVHFVIFLISIVGWFSDQLVSLSAVRFFIYKVERKLVSRKLYVGSREIKLSLV
jgi:hypothetical protein